MRSRGTLATALLGSTLALGCGEATAPLGELTIANTPTTVAALRSASGQPLWGQFALDVTLRNSSSSSINVGFCNPAVERELSGGGWVSAVEPNCASVDGVMTVLEPMIERTERAVAGALPFNANPQLLGLPVAGRYRLVFQYGTVGNSGLTQEARSAPFDVVE
jgi:hypothetical protein